jgi:hypothetical protein
MAPTTRGHKKKEIKSAEFIEEKDDFLVDDEASDVGSEEYNGDEYVLIMSSNAQLTCLSSSNMEVDSEEEEEEEEAEYVHLLTFLAPLKIASF